MCDDSAALLVALLPLVAAQQHVAGEGGAAGPAREAVHLDVHLLLMTAHSNQNFKEKKIFLRKSLWQAKLVLVTKFSREKLKQNFRENEENVPKKSVKFQL